MNQHASELANKIRLKVSNYFRKRNTAIGTTIWAINYIIILFLIYFVLGIILDKFGYLHNFSVVAVLVFQFLVGIFFRSKGTDLYSFMNNLPLLSHILSFLFLASVYCLSMNHLWKNKENYLKP